MEKKKKIYIAGKISGLPKEEVTEKFNGLQEDLQYCGFEVINPLEVVGDWNVTWEFAMKQCIKALVDCDAVYLMECHEQSVGAMAELQIANWLKIPCVTNALDLPLLWNN